MFVIKKDFAEVLIHLLECLNYIDLASPCRCLSTVISKIFIPLHHKIIQTSYGKGNNEHAAL